MAKFLVGIFDSSDMAADAIEALKPKYIDEVSFIGLDMENEQAIERIVDDNTDSIQFRSPYFGTVSGIIGPVFGSTVSLEVSGLGRLAMGGDIGDALTVSPYLISRPVGDLKNALQEIGFDKNFSHDYSGFISNGRIIIFVKTKKKTQNNVGNKLERYGALSTEYTENILLD